MRANPRYRYSPETIIKAYSLGLFPMATSHDSPDIQFYDPDRRALIPLDATIGDGLHIPRRLQRKVRRSPYDVSFNKDFVAVISECATPTARRTDTWINKDIKTLFIALHRMGFAHSVEVWQEGILIGGLYGIAVRAAFFGESMFSRRTDASKIALVHLMARLQHGGFLMLDAQFTSNHLKQFNVTEISRDDFQTQLAVALVHEADLHQTISSADFVGRFLTSLR